MLVNLNPSISFRSQTSTISPIVEKNDREYAEPKPRKDRGGFIEDISKIAKFFTTLSEMTKASFKAAGYGLLTAAVALTGFWTFDAIPRTIRNGNALIDTFKHPLKNISKKGKVLSAIASIGVAGYQIIKGKLKANQRTANVDHQLKTGHRDV